MLKEFFTRIKSEKSKTNSIATEEKKSDFDIKNQQEQPFLTIRFPPYQLPSLHLVPTIPTIHYRVLPTFPDLTLSILQCPIPFHTLPYSNRRVKQISTTIHSPIPQYATYLLSTFSSHLHQPNHFLINDYPSGIGIMPHFDGPAYHPKVLVYSIGTTTIKFVNEKGKVKRLLLEDKSLHMFENEAYTEYMHGIDDYGVDCIFFKVEGGEVGNCSVDNFKETEIYQKLVERKFEQCTIGEYEISKIIGNEQYTHQLVIPRKRRTSITIRHKYP